MGEGADKKRPPVGAIVGPTAVGKSEIALEVAARLKAEIISVDSTQVYRGLDIGTAKLLPHQRISRSGVYIPHHLIDIVDPDEPFSVADYQRMAREAIRDIHARGRLPLLVGGTGLYFQAVIDPYVFLPGARDISVRARLKKEAEERGLGYLYRVLEAVDKEAARRIHPHDQRRIVRALEFYYLTGEPISSTWVKNKKESPYRLALAGLSMERRLLYERINLRVDKMLEAGLVEEVRGLLRKGYSPDLPALQALGYKEIIAYLQGKVSLEEAIYILKRNTRRYAKRQLTWFRRDPRIRWWEVEPEKFEEISSSVALWMAGQLGIDVE
ncbi:MAG: tRNA (adenosine(37)-N6)-dimethylallyltransferase MiaA [Thermanaeromonas sp.]|uniref:tRNA (adenosine(37)-N6)-dimethylallyltransferase MiaA n=1 Tax=Thermanaeromonas sp. TaxID=2003697 RepID=UPI002439F02F|nr:tRNA (adenosine(37)-N6)-dimethylallyltransferase MiaA [Thermanaeromonas sp.]MCG0277815.1 tRNA (adenosine(37)-N6)-dimethylallyltransferase MiaA [Thermanaeromonas sp.]